LCQDHASRIGFLRGAPQEHLIGPMADYVRSHGGHIHTDAQIRQIELNAAGDSVVALHVAQRVPNGVVALQRVPADYFVLALPIHNLKKLIPPALQSQPYFGGLMKLSGVPVVTVHLWTDRQISGLDNCLFSPDGVIPVYADMANTTPEYRTPGGGSRFQFVVAPAKDLIGLSDEQIVDKVWTNVRDIFPATSEGARITKSVVVRVPQSVYGPYPGVDQYRVT
jgi:15-cis-phytoene desaturase